MIDESYVTDQASAEEFAALQGAAHVKVCPVLDRDVGMIFALGGHVDQGTQGSVKGHVIRLKEGTPRIINFHLSDETSISLSFDERQPIWITARDECPESPSWVPGFEWRLQTARHLRLKNPGTRGVFTYTLRLRNGTDVHLCDPIIKNIA